jgi:hypothetical protein
MCIGPLYWGDSTSEFLLDDVVLPKQWRPTVMESTEMGVACVFMSSVLMTCPAVKPC